MSNNGLYGCCFGFRAIFLNTFGIYARALAEGLGMVLVVRVVRACSGSCSDPAAL